MISSKKILLLIVLIFTSCSAKHEPRILLVHTVPWLGGDGIHTFNLLKMLHAHGYHADILVTQNTKMHQLLRTNNVHCYTTPHEQTGVNAEITKNVAQSIIKICKQNNISLVHCNYRSQVPSLLQAAKKVSIKTVLTYHLPYQFKPESLFGLDGVINVDPFMQSHIWETNRRFGFKIKNVAHIAPLFDAEKFLALKSNNETRSAFFKKTFDITLDNEPLIVVVANMYTNLQHKNYPLLFDALRQLVIRKKKSIRVIAAGDGPSRAKIQKMAVKKGLKDIVSFVGFTDKIPELLNHADAVVLASSYEAFGIILLEAGLMQKPTVAAFETGAEQIILDGKTGLLFRKNNALDLALKIEKIIDNETYARSLGKHAYNHILSNFLPEITFAKIESFYRDILSK